MLNQASLAPINSYLLRPDTQVILNKNWYQLITPSLREVDLNEVIISLMPRQAVNECIRHVFATYRNYDLPFNWVTAPGMCKPADFPKRIARLAETAWLFHGLVAPTDLVFAIPPDIETELIDAHNFQELLAVAGSKDPARYYPALTSGSSHLHFIARINGAPAGMAGLVLKKDHGYLVSSSTLPEFQGRGVYRALVKARLNHLKHLGFKFAVTQAKATTSAPILKRMGFSELFAGTVYQFAPGTRDDL